MSFGKPNYDGNKGFKKKGQFDTSDGDVVCRIFPPFGPLKDKGIWSVFHAVHWGYKNAEGKHRPFESCLEEKYDKETKARTVLVRDAALDRLNNLSDQLKTAKAEKNDQLVARLNTLVGFGGTYNIDKNQHMNVMLLDGRAGELKIRYKHFLALKAKIEELRSEGVDPLSLDDGRFFVFHKDGKGNETNFVVSVYKEKIDVPGVGRVERDVVSKIGPEVLTRLETELFDLDNIFSKPTAEEVAEIVASSDLKTGRSPACDRIFDAKWKAKRAATAQGAAPAPAAAAPATQASAPAATAPAASAPAAAAPAAAAPAASSFAQPAAAPKTQAQAIDEQTDDEFFASIDAKL